MRWTIALAAWLALQPSSVSAQPEPSRARGPGRRRPHDRRRRDDPLSRTLSAALGIRYDERLSEELLGVWLGVEARLPRF